MSVNLTFGIGEQSACFDVNIINDTICEFDPFEHFFADLTYVSGEHPILIDPAKTSVLTNDTAEPECGKMITCVNFDSYVHDHQICRPCVFN